MTALDFNDAKPNEFELLPDNTEVPVIFKVQPGDSEDGCIKRAQSGALMLNLEATVTAGKYAKRKLFFAFFMGREDGDLTEGQQTGVDMSRSKLRAIAEAARGFAPTDETAPAIAARKLKGYRDFDGMECSVILGIEKGTGAFSDKNSLKRVVPHGKAGKYDAGAEAASMRAAGSQQPASAASAKKGW